jgi:hypothetical protein
MQDGLLPIFVHPETGRFQYQEIRLGSRGDSYYGNRLALANIAWSETDYVQNI